MSSGLFVSRELMSDAEIEAVFRDEAVETEAVMVPDSDEYFVSRRKLLGPVADITHLEFGRSNRREETYGVFYRAKETLVSTILEIDEDGNKSSHPIHRYQIDEYAYDSDLNIVQVEDL